MMIFKKPNAVYELANGKFAVYAGDGKWWDQMGAYRFKYKKFINELCLFSIKEDAIKLAKTKKAHKESSIRRAKAIKAIKIRPIRKVWP